MRTVHPVGQMSVRVAKFLRLWVVLILAYLSTKFVLNLALFGWIDVRPVAAWELLTIPSVQALVLWMISERPTGTGKLEP
jgi:hypothetical protein